MKNIILTLSIIITSNVYAENLVYNDKIIEECKEKISSYVQKHNQFELDGCDAPKGGNCDDIVPRKPLWVIQGDLMGFDNDGYRCKVGTNSNGDYKLNKEIIVLDVNG